MPYCPPEVFTQRTYTYAQDIFSFGVLAIKVITGSLPFRAVDSLIGAFKAKKH